MKRPVYIYIYIYILCVCVCVCLCAFILLFSPFPNCPYLLQFLYVPTFVLLIFLSVGLSYV